MKKLLVICHGNRYRSPFAEGFIRQLGVSTIESAGVKLPIGNYPAAKPTREAAAARGFDLTTHRAKGLSQRLINWADMILYMDNGNLRRLLEQFPEAEDKAECLASYVGKSRVPDPCFLTGAPREAVWTLLEDTCKAVVRALK